AARLSGVAAAVAQVARVTTEQGLAKVAAILTDVGIELGSPAATVLLTAAVESPAARGGGTRRRASSWSRLVPVSTRTPTTISVASRGHPRFAACAVVWGPASGPVDPCLNLRHAAGRRHAVLAG